MKALFLLASLAVSTFGLANSAQADIPWKSYDQKLVDQAAKDGKTVVLGFHKKGCGTCHRQDKVLKGTGILDKKDVVFLKVERKNSDHTKVYEKYGFNTRQWASLILLNNNKEVARVDPGITSSDKVAAFTKSIR